MNCISKVKMQLKDATIDVKYNGGTLDLTQYLNVHYTQADIKAAADDAEHRDYGVC